MEDENTPRGGGLGRFFSGSRGRLLLIGGGVIALFLLVKHFAQNIAPAPSTGAPPLGTGTTIYEPTILASSGGSGGGTSGGSGGGTSGGSGGGTGATIPSGRTFSFAQWLAEIKQYGGQGIQHPRWPTQIETDPNLTPQQRGQLIDIIGGGPAPRLATNLHPAGTAGQRVAPIMPAYAGGH